ncbi:hypothetical protein C4K16_2386 [Pseudomonas chlororaphis subsp. aurantiaca]|nr:hypothetical protein C4K16_2386 [Pseudomonas chlororaphis subsp. aurantiaca]
MRGEWGIRALPDFPDIAPGGQYSSGFLFGHQCCRSSRDRYRQGHVAAMLTPR